LSDGASVTASAPSGASTGSGEARELRDGDARRYGGMGVLKAVAHVENDIAPLLRGRDPSDQSELDQLMADADATPDKSRFGANAIVAVSMAIARAGARARGIPLYRYLGAGDRLPVPMMNVINGGKHARSGLAFQEFMIVPHGAASFAEALRYGAECFAALKTLLERRGLSTGVGDEGGFAPGLGDEEEAVELIVSAIELAGYRPGADVALALDPAASSFFDDSAYTIAGGRRLDGAAMVEFYRRWRQDYPIVSIEDGFSEDDWRGFKTLTAALGDTTQIVGDDIFVTDAALIERGAKERAANAALIKLNQVGTVSETLKAIAACKAHGWAYVISHRSGETDDSFIADLAVAAGGGQIKTGSVCRGERIAKYNRLLAIERELGSAAQFFSPFR
jgi:enolase